MGTTFESTNGRWFHAPEWMRGLPKSTLASLAQGEAVTIGCGVYRICRGCYSVVRLNKWLFGDIHPCM